MALEPTYIPLGGSSAVQISPFKIPEDTLIIATIRLIFASYKYGVDGKRNNNAEGYLEEHARDCHCRSIAIAIGPIVIGSEMAAVKVDLLDIGNFISVEVRKANRNRGSRHGGITTRL